MERNPEDIAADPHLRQEYVGQQSWDEYCAEHATAFLEPDWEALLTERGLYPGPALKLFQGEWMNTLDPETNRDEILYLLGVSDRSVRYAVLDQEHAELRAAVISAGLATWDELEAIRRELEN